MSSFKIVTVHGCAGKVLSADKVPYRVINGSGRYLYQSQSDDIVDLLERSEHEQRSAGVQYQFHINGQWELRDAFLKLADAAILEHLQSCEECQEWQGYEPSPTE